MIGQMATARGLTIADVVEMTIVLSRNRLAVKLVTLFFQLVRSIIYLAFDDLFIYIYWFFVPGFTFLLPAHPGSPEQSPGGRKTVVLVCIG